MLFILTLAHQETSGIGDSVDIRKLKIQRSIIKPWILPESLLSLQTSIFCNIHPQSKVPFSTNSLVYQTRLMLLYLKSYLSTRSYSHGRPPQPFWEQKRCSVFLFLIFFNSKIVAFDGVQKKNPRVAILPGALVVSRVLSWVPWLT